MSGDLDSVTDLDSRKHSRTAEPDSISDNGSLAGSRCLQWLVTPTPAASAYKPSRSAIVSPRSSRFPNNSTAFGEISADSLRGLTLQLDHTMHGRRLL